MEPIVNEPDAKKGSRNDKDTPIEDDPFRQIGEAEPEVEGPPSPEVSATATTIPVGFETPSIHMEQGIGEEEDVFAKLGAGGETSEEVTGDKKRPAAGQGSSSEPIQMVEEAANDLFDSLGVEHYDPEEPTAELGDADRQQESVAATLISSSETTVSSKPSDEVDVREDADGQSHTISERVSQPDEVVSAETEPGQEDTQEAGDVFDTLDTADSVNQPIQSSVDSGASTEQGPTETAGIDLDEGDDGDDVFATLASGGDEAQHAESIQELNPSSTIKDNAVSSDEAEKEGRGVVLDDRDDGDDVFATLASGDDVQQAETIEVAQTDMPTDRNARAIELVETADDALFDNIGTADDIATEPISQGAGENGDSAEEQKRKYQLLLEEFGGEEDFLPETQPAYQAANLFGDEPESTPFDEFIPTDYPQTASSSTTPPPNLSIENSLQDIESYEGDASMLTETSDWLGDTSTDADQSFQVQDRQTAAGAASSPLEFEVPYGWYEGDTFHYYTDEQREQVRLAMLEQQPQPESDTQTVPQSQDHSSTPLQAPTTISGFSENSARRTPNPDRYDDPYAPSSSRQLGTAATSYFGDSQYTASTANTDPYAPISSTASPVQPYNPYAPATPSAAPFDPYAQVVPAKQPIYYGNEKKPSPFNKSGPVAAAQRPAAPQRVASTAYDPPFLRPQKSFARPVSAAPIAPAAYGAPPVPPIQAAPTPPPPAAPPSGPPRRSTTPYAPPPPIVDRPARQPTPVQSAYAPAQPSYAPEEYDAPPASMPPPAGPPRGPPSRPSSSMSSARQAQRAPSYNSFDPPLRTQTLSRASMKAVQALAPPQHTPPAPSFAISPPTENVSQFDNSRPPSRGAPAFEAAPPPGPPRPSSRSTSGFVGAPPRPSSRAASGYEAAPPPGPPRPPSRSVPAVEAPPPSGPPRPPSRNTPAFEAPPTPGPPRRSTSSFQAPPRPPSVSQTYESNRPTPTPSRRESEMQMEDDEQYRDNRETPPASSYSIPQLHSGQEEPDEEGGVWDDRADEDELPQDMHATDEPQGAYGNEREVHDEPQNMYERPPARQAEIDSYQSESSYAPSKSNAASYDPYGPGQQDTPPTQGRTDSYQPETSYAPASSNASYYDPYGPGQHEAPPSQSRSDSYQPQPAYAPPQSQSGYSPVQSQSYDPYGPGQATSQAGQITSPYDPYAPSSTSPRAPLTEPSSLGLSSVGTSTQQNSYDSPYAPPRPAAEQYTPSADMHLRVASPGYGTEYGTSPPANNYFSALPHGPADQTYTPQQVLDQRPVSEDPLGRSTLAARNAPIAIFGFGGVLITAFPGMANAHNEAAGGHARTASYGYASGRGQLWIRSVSDLVSESALKSNETVFPGPLVLDPSSVKGAAGDKKKKEAVLEYLKARVEETEKGLPYLKTSANATRREQEGKLAVLRLLLAMIIGEGKLTGSTQVEDAVRTALQNPLEPSAGTTTFSPTSVTGPAVNGFSTSIYQGANQNAQSTAASPSQLSQLSTMLANGDKRDAALYAASNGLWSHALLISSSVDQEFWREIVTRFSGTELHAGVAGSAGLKASYTLFSGAGPTAIDDLFAAAHITDDPSSDQWREVIGAVLFNGKPTDLAYLNDLGARLTSAGLTNAGHVCSLLSPTSAFGDLTPGALERPISLVQSTRDEDAVIFAEIAEYARSLIPVPKGQELPFPGLPQLLPYKLHRAWWAAELGDHDLAKRYCKAVEAASKIGKSGTSLLSRPFLNSLEDLQERLTGEPSTKPANLIGGRKAGKPGVNKLGSWIEGRLTKFIAGEEDTEGPIKATPPTKGKESSGAPVGPFSHFSTISPGPSNPVTRAASTADIANGQYGGRLSPAPQGSGHQQTSSSSSSTYGEQYGARGGYGGYDPYSGPEGGDETGGNEDTPHALEPAGDSGEVELLNPMAALSLGPTRQAQDNYGPPKPRAVEEEEDEDDLGFGNTSLSRARTPKPAEGGDDKGKKKDTAPAKAATPEPAASGKNEQKSGWLRGWFGKKEGEGSGPIVAKLGEESSMIFDPELKRWIVKGAKPEPAAAAPPPPPPSRPQSAAPASRASSATPPPSSLSRSTGPSGMPPRSSTTGMGFTEMPDGGFKRQKSSLSESVTPSGPTPPPGGAGGPPRPPSGPPKPPGSSIDDLLSRPPSKRPASAARKGVKNRYVDVFQGEGNK